MQKSQQDNDGGHMERVRNCEVMAKLYISEGTLNRTRRNAVQGVAMWLFERTCKGEISIEFPFHVE